MVKKLKRNMYVYIRLSNQMCGLAVIAGLFDLFEPGLKLCSLLLHVLNAGIHLSLDLLAVHGKCLQHIVSACAAVTTVFQQSFELLFCQRGERKTDTTTNSDKYITDHVKHRRTSLYKLFDEVFLYAHDDRQISESFFCFTGL